MATKTEFRLITESFDNRIIKYKPEYAKRVYQAIADYLDMTLEGAYKEEIIPSKFPHILNPHRLRKLQHCTDDKLTSRTGKMTYMMKHVVSPWKTTEGGMVKKTAGLSLRVTKKKGVNVMEFEGTIRPEIHMDGRLSSIGRGMPLETTRSLTLRFYWETGIRGNKRQYLLPQAKKHFADYGFRLSKLKEGMP